MRTISPNSVPSMTTAPMSPFLLIERFAPLDSVHYLNPPAGWLVGRTTVPQRPSTTNHQPAGAPPRATRRPRGEPRQLLLDAARDLFSRHDYRSTTTREIAEAAGVTEPLLFRHFGSKAALFREALVMPFTTFVEDFGRTWQAVVPEKTDEDELARHFVGHLYDVFVEHRGLVMTLLASEVLSEEETADAGIADIRRALAVLGQISVEGMQLRGVQSSRPDLAAYSTVAMIAGMAALRSTYFETKQPSRAAIVDELTQAILHGFLHRDGSPATVKFRAAGEPVSEDRP
jgi:AcrR family transcriptional regulator